MLKAPHTFWLPHFPPPDSCISAGKLAVAASVLLDLAIVFAVVTLVSWFLDFPVGDFPSSGKRELSAVSVQGFPSPLEITATASSVCRLHTTSGNICSYCSVCLSVDISFLLLCMTGSVSNGFAAVAR